MKRPEGAKPEGRVPSLTWVSRHSQARAAPALGRDASALSEPPPSSKLRGRDRSRSAVSAATLPPRFSDSLQCTFSSEMRRERVTSIALELAMGESTPRGAVAPSQHEVKLSAPRPVRKEFALPSVQVPDVRSSSREALLQSRLERQSRVTKINTALVTDAL
uniref:Uncharacterized protein n=1 Tax=Haptolina ericina TaxID=156174 RepID=A0A7S3BIR5_9EUKA